MIANLLLPTALRSFPLRSMTTNDPTPGPADAPRNTDPNVARRAQLLEKAAATNHRLSGLFRVEKLSTQANGAPESNNPKNPNGPEETPRPSWTTLPAR